MSAWPALLDSIDPALEILPFNRRLSIRYPYGLATTTKLQVVKSGEFERVLAINISQGGVAVILDEPLDVGSVIHIRMKNRILNFTYDLAAQVVRTAVQDDGRWLVGMAFARQLTRSELASLL